MAYPYAHIAAILTFLVIPAAAIVSFLLTPFARRRRLLTWLLIPVIYVVVTYIGVVVAVNLGYLEL